MIKKNIRKKKILFYKNEILKRYSGNLNNIFSWMKKLNLENPIILDVGACIGMYSICYSKMYKNSKIFAFEPVIQNYQILKKNVKINKIKNISKINIGLSNENKNASIGIPDKSVHSRYAKEINSGLFSIFSKEKKFKIKLKKLDSLIQINKLKKIDFIKIDVEGAEYKVLEGGIKTIKKYKPTIQLEFNKLSEALGKKKINYFYSFAQKYKYNIFYLTKNYKLKDRLKKKGEFFSDLVFIKKK